MTAPIGSPASDPLPAVIINIDDVGMCHGANTAFVDLAKRGRCDSGSVMVPCPWFLEIAEMGRADPSLNLGVHLTITSEKKYYRWRPLTAPGRTSGLTDADGYFWRSVPEVRRHAAPEAIEAELRAQIDTFLHAGLKPTHLDAHMGGALSPEFVDIYVRLGAEYSVPILFPRSIASYDPIHNLGGIDTGPYEEKAKALEAAGLTLIDRVLETPWHQDQPAQTRYRSLFGQIGAGVTFMALHANAPGELEAIEPSSAAIRTGEYDVLRAPESADFIDALKVRRGSLSDFSSPSSAP
jgi:chitin disaccharide deacetylase